MPRRHVVIARPVNRLKIYGLSGPTTLPLEHMPSHYKAALLLRVSPRYVVVISRHRKTIFSADEYCTDRSRDLKEGM